MSSIEEVLDSLGKDNPQIIETGCRNTQDIARWVSKHPDSDFINVDTDFQLQLATHRELEKETIARYCRFLVKDHNLYLSSRTWVDVVFLNPSDLQTGLTEFLLAISTGAGIIVINDYQTRGALAIKRAREINWDYESSGHLNILRRK